jgi:hypothetical protein
MLAQPLLDREALGGLTGDRYREHEPAFDAGDAIGDVGRTRLRNERRGKERNGERRVTCAAPNGECQHHL